MKYCSICREHLPEESFTRNAERKDGLSYYCGKCSAEKLRKWRSTRLERLASEKREYRKQNPDKEKVAIKKWREGHEAQVNAIHKRNRLAVRHKVFEMYGGKCACCGESHYEFLSLDHVNGGGLQHRKVETYQQLLYRLVREGISPLYRVLCFNCNCALGFSGYCPHQKGI